MSTRRRILVAMLISASLCSGTSADKRESELAKTILKDERLTEVLNRAKAVLATGFGAGDAYGEVWIRDLATFIELACEVNEIDKIRECLLMFFSFQGEDGNVIDGYIPVEHANAGYAYIHAKSAPNYLGHKNTVETDQESSLILAVCLYVEKTGDRTILDEVIDKKSVADRMAWAMEYLRNHRYSEDYGLIWGATTADWGDVQPEHIWGVVLDESSHRAIDIYDNALFIAALDAYLSTVEPDPDEVLKWSRFRDQLKGNVRQHLWDAKREKFIPHIYLEDSPFPADLDENAIYYHGGTAIAIQANLLTPEEVARAIARMAANVRDAKAASIGLTMYPPYPKGMYKNPSMSEPYSYQNGGDWTWFGARIIQQLVRYGLIEEAYRELEPMIDRVIENDGFYEWYTRNNEPRGSGTYRGSAGVLGKAIQMLQTWAEKNAMPSNR